MTSPALFPGATAGALVPGADAVGEGAGFALAGGPGARLLAGPPSSEGAETYRSHLARLGPLRLSGVPAATLLAEIAGSGLLGRGGAQFPATQKLGLAAGAGPEPIVVVNAAEGEPASAKDRVLMQLRPHLVIDGAAAAAHAVGAGEVVIYTPARPRVVSALVQAAAERPPEGVSFRLVCPPDRFVAGESSAVVNFIENQVALPRRRTEHAALSGVAGRPTVVNNVETVAHLGLIARYGAGWFAQAGSAASPGSTLLTVAGEVASPGTVVEVVGSPSIGQVLEAVGGIEQVPRAVLIGGYAGTWLDGEIAWRTPLSRGALAEDGLSLGCGVVAVLSHYFCGLATTARLVRWLSGQSAGQCGSCVFGLPAVARLIERLAAGDGSKRDVRRLRELTADVAGRGACSHPDGVSGLVDSALETFAAELREHLRGNWCLAAEKGFPLDNAS